MITRIKLSNWRAYGNVAIQLEPGTTFLIGMNGVGKSSLVEAVRWAFDRTAKPDVEFIRKGERSAFVEVDLQVDQAVLRINREISLGTGARPLKTPRTELTATVDDRVVTEAELFARLETAWGADIGFVTRTAFLDDLSSSSKDSELRAHLSRAYALDTLEEHVGVFEQAVKQAGVVASEEHAAAGQLVRRIDRSRREVEEQEELLRASEARAGDHDVALEAANAALVEAQRAQAALDARARWDARWQQVAEAAAAFVGEPSPGTDLRPLLRSSLEAASRQRDEAREVNARLRERMAALEEALATLDAAAQECPVCRRPLDDESRAHAHEVQDADRVQVGRELEEVDIEGPSTVVSGLQRLIRDA
ncbi:MAG TPA: AAA family ATPase, partial [Iamia sp.]